MNSSILVSTLHQTGKHKNTNEVANRIILGQTQHPIHWFLLFQFIQVHQDGILSVRILSINMLLSRNIFLKIKENYS